MPRVAVFLELGEALDCPECREAAGLVAFVDRAEGRRVIEGRLGCPLCELAAPVRRGTIRFDLVAGGVAGASGSSGTESQRPATPPERAGRRGESGDADDALRIGALLGVTGSSGMTFLLGPGLARHAPAVARMCDRGEVIAWQDAAASRAAALDLAGLTAGVNPLRGAQPESWPVRSGALHGVALDGAQALSGSEIARCIRVGGRVVILSPAPEHSGVLARPDFAELAGSETAWVGERKAPTATI